MKVSNTYMMIDSHFIDIKNARPFVQQFADGVRTQSTYDRAYIKTRDHVQDWKLLTRILQIVAKLSDA